MITNHYQSKPFVLLPHKAEPSLMDRHVQWLKKERGIWGKVGITALEVFEAIALTATGFGMIVLYKGIKKIKKIDHERAFLEHVAQIPKPLSDQQISFKTKLQTFNHTHEFMLKNDTIWFRLRHSKNDWDAMYFDGFPSGYIPTKIDCDGSNLVVLDQHHQVHYKKVLREFRGEEVGNDKRVQDAISGAAPAYICIDKTGKNNWKDKWFSLPFLHVIGNLITGKLLKLPKDMRAWAISHRGRYSYYIEDSAKQQHQVGAGVTTLYVLDKNGKDIFKYDPWSPKNAKMNVYLPESANKSYEAINLDASASTLMAIGYESTTNGQTLKIITRLVDIDSEGWNPGLKYDYFKNEKDPDVRVVPMPTWQEHPLILEGNIPITNISKHITITQIGEGNDARELRVAGQKDGKNGEYFKHLTDSYWQFEEVINSPYDEPLVQFTQSNGPFNSTVHDYKLKEGQIDQQKESISAELFNFGMRSFDSTMKLNIGSKAYELHLYKKKTLKNFFGLNSDTYELVLPNVEDEHLKKMFKGKKVIPISVKEDKKGLHINSSYFKLNFESKA